MWCHFSLSFFFVGHVKSVPFHCCVFCFLLTSWCLPLWSILFDFFQPPLPSLLFPHRQNVQWLFFFFKSPLSVSIFNGFWRVGNEKYTNISFLSRDLIQALAVDWQSSLAFCFFSLPSFLSSCFPPFLLPFSPLFLSPFLPLPSLKPTPPSSPCSSLLFFLSYLSI